MCLFSSSSFLSLINHNYAIHLEFIQSYKDNNTPLQTLDILANWIGLTPPFSNGTCLKAFFLFNFHYCFYFILSFPARQSLVRTLLSSPRSPPVTHPPSAPRSSLTHRTSGSSGNRRSSSSGSSQDTFRGSLWQSPSNMSPAWRQEIRTWGSTVPPRSVFGPGQVGQVWASFWILLLLPCIPSAQAQGKMRNSVLFYLIERSALRKNVIN